MESKVVTLTTNDDPSCIDSLNEEQVTTYIDNYLNNVLKITSERQYASLLEFFELLERAIRAKENTESVPNDRRLWFSIGDPPENIDTEAITFSLQGREPGQIGRGSAASPSNVKEVISHLRSIEEHPEHLGEKIVTLGRFYDNYILFKIYAKDEKTLMKRLLWFEFLIEEYRWFFRLHRVPQIVELSVSGNKSEEIDGLKLKCYHVVYVVRTEDVTQFSSQTLKAVEIKLNVDTHY